jgi:hypothetical protein
LTEGERRDVDHEHEVVRALAKPRRCASDISDPTGSEPDRRSHVVPKKCRYLDLVILPCMAVSRILSSRSPGVAPVAISSSQPR